MKIKPSAFIGLLSNSDCRFEEIEKGKVIEIYDEKGEVVGYIMQDEGKLTISLEFRGESMPNLPRWTEKNKNG